jgi:hypothetical protein
VLSWTLGSGWLDGVVLVDITGRAANCLCAFELDVELTQPTPAHS